jgi:cytochrome oxidase Cu insertion factor (SCO1/SenC/PrrC family)
MGRPKLALAALLAVCVALVPAAGALADAKVDRLLWDLQVIPLEPSSPPPLAGKDVTGTAISLSQFKGRPIVLYFWATW